MKKIQVKKIREDRGFCREYFQDLKHKRVTYCRQEEFPNVFKWYTTIKKTGEPAFPIIGAEFEIIESITKTCPNCGADVIVDDASDSISSCKECK